MKGEITFNKIQSTYAFDDALRSGALDDVKGALPVCLGYDESGNCVCGSLARMPHMLVCGSIGSGKSVLLHSVVASLVSKYTAEQLHIALVDSKAVESVEYKNLPQVTYPVVTDCRYFAELLEELRQETERRYGIFRETGVFDIENYNAKFTEDKLPYVVVVVDELFEMLCDDKQRKKIQNALAAVMQKSRAAGIHFVMSTARLDLKYIPTPMLVNVPMRAVFKVSFKAESARLSGVFGAETLEHGEMLFVDGLNNSVVHLKAVITK